MFRLRVYFLMNFCNSSITVGSGVCSHFLTPYVNLFGDDKRYVLPGLRCFLWSSFYYKSTDRASYLSEQRFSKRAIYYHFSFNFFSMSGYLRVNLYTILFGNISNNIKVHFNNYSMILLFFISYTVLTSLSDTEVM